MSRTDDPRIHDADDFTAPFNPTLPQAFAISMNDHFMALHDVLKVLDFTESLVDPMMLSGRLFAEIEREQLGAWLRMVSREFDLRLHAARKLLAGR